MSTIINEEINIYMELKIYMMPVATEVLGPYKRCVFWVQGCNKRCKPYSLYRKFGAV